MKTLHTDFLVIGGGITGLTLAYYLRTAGKRVILAEKDSRVGGVIRTWQEKGFVFESGPNTGVVGSAELVELFDHLRGRVELETACPDARFRWIWKNGKWESLPSGFKEAIQTPLFTWKDKIRILGEPFRRRGTNPDESVADMVVRRLGTSYLHYAVNPFISGVYAGNPEQLITRYALPKLYNLEQKYGSFILGSVRKKSEPKTETEKRISRAVFSIKGGLQRLPDALASAIGDEHILKQMQDFKVQPSSEGYLGQGKTLDGEVEIHAAKVISTVDGLYVPELFPFMPSEPLKDIVTTRYASVVQVVAGYSKWEGKSLKAFGGLVPSCEKKNVLGILFPASIFPDRAPQGGALLSIFMGGIHHPELLHQRDEEIQKMALLAIQEMLGCSLQPDVFHIFRHARAIPQYEISTGKRLEAIRQLETSYPGITLAGNIRDGIGMSDRIKQGRQLADLFISQP